MGTREVAEVITHDLDGDRYFAEPAILSRYLRAKLRVPEERAAGAARVILLDRRRPGGHYRTAPALAGLLDRWLSVLQVVPGA